MANFAALGTTGKPFPVRIERGKIMEFAAATRSRNPAYWAEEHPVVPPTFLTTQMFWQDWAGEDANPLFARAAGYDAPLAIGMLGAGLLGTYATDWLGASNVRRLRIRFRAQVWPGDTLTCSGEVMKEYDEEEGPFADIELSCARQTGEVAVQAWATFALDGKTWT